MDVQFSNLDVSTVSLRPAPWPEGAVKIWQGNSRAEFVIGNSTTFFYSKEGLKDLPTKSKSTGYLLEIVPSPELLDKFEEFRAHVQEGRMTPLMNPVLDSGNVRFKIDENALVTRVEGKKFVGVPLDKENIPPECGVAVRGNIVGIWSIPGKEEGELVEGYTFKVDTIMIDSNFKPPALKKRKAHW